MRVAKSRARILYTNTQPGWVVNRAKLEFSVKRLLYFLLDSKWFLGIWKSYVQQIFGFRNFRCKKNVWIIISEIGPTEFCVIKLSSFILKRLPSACHQNEVEFCREPSVNWWHKIKSHCSMTQARKKILPAIYRHVDIVLFVKTPTQPQLNKIESKAW